MKESVIKKQVIAYVTGFGLSVFATFLAFVLAGFSEASGGVSFSSTFVFVSIIVLAVLQLGVQLVYFLHLGREPKPRLNGMAFAFMTMVVLIIGLGSVWVMYNLDYNMMPKDPEKHMEIEENINVDHSSMSH